MRRKELGVWQHRLSVTQVLQERDCVRVLPEEPTAADLASPSGRRRTLMCPMEIRIGMGP